jgi:hypothetical protein
MARPCAFVGAGSALRTDAERLRRRRTRDALRFRSWTVNGRALLRAWPSLSSFLALENSAKVDLGTPTMRRASRGHSALPGFYALVRCFPCRETVMYRGCQTRSDKSSCHSEDAVSGADGSSPPPRVVAGSRTSSAPVALARPAAASCDDGTLAVSCVVQPGSDL